jgi:hypothetical protein
LGITVYLCFSESLKKIKTRRQLETRSTGAHGEYMPFYC